MQAVSLPGDRRVEVVQRPMPSPGAGEVLVRTRASAICRSDMSLYSGTPIVGSTVAGSVTPGHEAAGDIVQVGSGVNPGRVGERVAAYLPLGCGHCDHCRAGYLMLCAEWKCFGFDVDGGDADYFVLPEKNCLELPQPLSYVDGALLTDMVGTQFHTQRMLHVIPGETLAVFGLGPMGAAAVMIGRALGAEVIAIDLLPARLSLATKLGASHAINSAEIDPVQAVMDLTAGRGAQVAVDCSGAPAAQNAALNAAAKRGRVAFVGESRSTTINPSDQIIRKLLTVVGGWYFPLYEFDEITDFALTHQLPVEELVTHRFDLAQAPEAFRAFDQRETEKAVFVWDDDRS
ncbi:MAG: L-iditol 2-dehydrogenase [Actinomycetota bacterium]|nr:L-iditol 2-dehydrogenase [Actinomycetota bacterium]